jgi:hypothetical protein
MQHTSALLKAKTLPDKQKHNSGGCFLLLQRLQTWNLVWECTVRMMVDLLMLALGDRML